MAKRLFDLLAALALLLVLSPLLACLYVVLFVSGVRPVFFRQLRPGLKGRPFELIKFRTMRDDRDAAGELLSDAQRITPVGRWLRRSSLDELPELLNVVRGEMSLVGPRPLLMEYLPLYSPEQARRHDVRPGMTGWAQVNGRNALEWHEKFRLDVWYVEHQSLMLDLRILGRTLRSVLRAEGISKEGHVTTERFTGREK